MGNSVKKTLLVSVLLVFLFVGCGQKKTEPKENNSQSSVTEESLIESEAILETSDSVTSSSTINQTATSSTQSTALPAVVDFDTEAIANGDLTTLAGTWKNGKGDILVINLDGTTADGATIVNDLPKNNASEITSLSIRTGNTGAALLLYKIGVENPEGDQSDRTKPRLMITQSGDNYPAEDYFYRQG